MPGGKKAVWEDPDGARSSDPDLGRVSSGDTGSVKSPVLSRQGVLGGGVGRGPGHLVRSPDTRRGGWGQSWVRDTGQRWGKWKGCGWI